MSSLRFRVLGPVEVLRDQEPIALGSGMKLDLLTALLVSPNQLVAIDALAEIAWDRSAPEHPRAALQTAISRLRRLLGEDVVETVGNGNGYLIRVAADDLDLLTFGRLVETADALAADGAEQAALEVLDEAVRLWRNPIMGNVSSVVLHRDVVPKLTDQRLDAIEKRARLSLRLGRHESLAAELTSLVRIFPFRERLTASLMLALYRSDRQADALTAYEELRRRLDEELGIEPAAEIQDLYLSILRSEPRLRVSYPDIGPEAGLPLAANADIPAPAGGAGGQVRGGTPRGPGAPRQLPADIAFFVGRESELAAVGDVLAGDGPAGTRIAIVTGPGGGGKTALAVRAAHSLADAYPDGQLYVNLQGTSACPASPGEVLSRLLRGLGVAGSAIPADEDERAALYRSTVASQRVLIVLDDAASESQIRPLLPAAAGCGVIVTSRSPITGLPGGLPILLGMLDDEDAVVLMGLIAGTGRVQRQHADARAIARLCGGLPLALRVAGARLAARPHWRLSTLAGRLGDRRRRLSELRHSDLDVRASLALSYQGLAPGTQVLFRRIGLLDAPDFPAWAAAALLDVSVLQASELIDCLVDAQLLGVVGHPTVSGPRFRCHDLVRDFARELAEDDDLAACQDALGRAFGALLGLAEYAHRGVYGGDYSILHGPAPRWQAPDMDPAQLIGDATMTWFEGERLAIAAAVRQGAEAGMDELCWDLAWTSVTLFEAGSYLDEWRTAERQALAAARRAGNRRGEAAMLASLGACMLAQRSYTAGYELCEQATRLFTEIGDQHGYGLAQRSLVLADSLAGRLESALARSQVVLSAVRSTGDRFLEVGIMCDMASAYLELGQLGRAERCLAEALPISREIGSSRAQAFTLHRLGELHLRQGQLDQAECAFRQALTFARVGDDRPGQAYTQLGLAEVWAEQGQSHRAESLMRDVLDTVRQLRHRGAEGRALLMLGKAEARRADHAAATRSLLASAAIFGDCGIPLSQAAALEILATVYRAAGEQAAAEHASRQAEHLRADAASPAQHGSGAA